MNSLNGGYAMIKYNSTQEELQIAYRSKKPVLCYDENRRAHWAVIEETATESVDEETQDPIIIYEYSYRLIDEASGGKLYNHKLYITGGSSSFIENLNLEIINKSNTPLTYNDLATYFPSSYTAKYKCCGTSSRPSKIADVDSNPYAYFANEEGVFYAKSIFANSIDTLSNTATFTDIVTEV